MHNRFIALGAFAVLTATTMWGQQAPPAPHPMPMPPGRSMQMPMHGPAPSGQMPMDCQPMMQKMQSMRASQKAMDDRLASLVADMNKARGSAKVDRMAAVINEMVAQRKQMRDDIAAMMPQMMQHMMQHMQSGMMGAMQSMANCPMMGDAAMQTSGHAGHHAGVMARGAMGMGFSQEKTTHHFVLLATGGDIEVTANDATDSASINAIRGHLQHIASAFSSGDFALPMFIHGQTPPGVETMKRLQKQITYRYEEIPGGGRVVITTSNADAIDAVHDFLRFQIQDHSTGDPLTVRQ